MKSAIDGSDSLKNSIFNATSQISIVTDDLMATVRGYADELGVGPWWINTYAPPELSGMTYRGEKVEHSFRIALAWTGTFNWEIIQPLEGASIYREFLEKNGPGVHHVGFFTPDLDMSLEEAMQEVIGRGGRITQTGKLAWGIDWFYFETDRPTSVCFEVIRKQPKLHRPDPEMWYPASPEDRR